MGLLMGFMLILTMTDKYAVVHRPRRCIRFLPPSREALGDSEYCPHCHRRNLDSVVLDHQA